MPLLFPIESVLCPTESYWVTSEMPSCTITLPFCTIILLFSHLSDHLCHQCALVCHNIAIMPYHLPLVVPLCSFVPSLFYHLSSKCPHQVLFAITASFVASQYPIIPSMCLSLLLQCPTNAICLSVVPFLCPTVLSQFFNMHCFVLLCHQCDLL